MCCLQVETLTGGRSGRVKGERFNSDRRKDGGIIKCARRCRVSIYVQSQLSLYINEDKVSGQAHSPSMHLHVALAAIDSSVIPQPFPVAQLSRRPIDYRTARCLRASIKKATGW